MEKKKRKKMGGGAWLRDPKQKHNTNYKPTTSNTIKKTMQYGFLSNIKI